MNPNLAHVLTYTAFWLLFVVGQAHNSVRSTSNGLDGWAGYMRWLKLQVVNLLTRAGFSAILYDWVMQSVTAKIHDTGLVLHAYAIAGIAGYAANALLYQAFGLIPFLRVEVQDLAPPANAQVVPAPPILPTPPTPPPSETRS